MRALIRKILVFIMAGISKTSWLKAFLKKIVSRFPKLSDRLLRIYIYNRPGIRLESKDDLNGEMKYLSAEAMEIMENI